jgi:antirestriction protein
MNTEHQEQPKAIPRIYVASLADYNSGRLVGKWIDATQEADAIHEEIREMLKQSREPIAEEWAIHDYEGFLGLNIEEYSSMENVAAAAKLVVEHGQLFAELVNHFGGLQHIEEAQQYLSEGYRGVFDKLEDFAEQFVDECYSDALKGLPDFIRYHIDYEGIARDMEMGGDVFTIECDHQVHVFDSNI